MNHDKVKLKATPPEILTPPSSSPETLTDPPHRKWVCTQTNEKFKMGKEKRYKEPNQDRNSPASSSAAEPSLRRAIELATSVISLSHSIKVFTVKWQPIRKNLEELLCGLTSVENSHSGGDNPSSLSGAVPEIIETFNECHDLARRCAELSYGGKLLMQSDLDIIRTKLDRHAKNLGDIYADGLLKNSYAIVVSRPGPAASREDMKFYVKDLVSRLKIGGKEMKKQALISFNEAIVEDEKYIKIAVEVGSLIGFLVSFLESQETELQEEAAKAVSVIVDFDSFKSVLIGAGMVPPLIGVLESGSEVGRLNSAKCLKKLTDNSENAWSVSAQGGVTALLKICSDCDCNGELAGLSCGVLKNLAGVEEIKRFMVEKGAIWALIRLLKARDEASQINSIELLQVMASGDDSIRQIVIREGGIRVLVRFFDPKSSCSLKAREVALRAVMNLCFSSMSTLNLLMNHGFMDRILYFLRYGEVSVQELALKAAFRLGGVTEEVKKSMGDAGFMQEIVKFLDAESVEVREMAAEALSSLVSVPRNRRLFLQNEQNLGLVLELLDPEQGNSGASKFLLSILMSLTSCHSARKKIVHSKYMKNIQKLAEAEVSDAKKIVSKLSSGRFLSMLSGIWNP